MTDHKPTYRVISILEKISNHQDGYTLSELTKLTDIPVGTISPILKTLVQYRLLEFDASTNRYMIGIQAYYYGSAFTSRNSTLEWIRKEMQEMSRECNETCQLGILKEGQIFYLVKVEGQEPIRVVSEVGKMLPAYTTALGKAILSKYDDSSVKQFYADGLTALTENTITDIDVLCAQLDEIRATGFATEEGESGAHTSCVAVPIMQDGEIVAGLSVVFPSFRKTPEKCQEVKACLLSHKKNIEKLLINHNLL